MKASASFSNGRTQDPLTNPKKQNRHMAITTIHGKIVTMTPATAVMPMVIVLKLMVIVAHRILVWEEEMVGLGVRDHVLNVVKRVTGALTVLKQITEIVKVIIRARSLEVVITAITIRTIAAIEIPVTLKMGPNNHILVETETVRKQVPVINVESLGTGVQVAQRQEEDISDKWILHEIIFTLSKLYNNFYYLSASYPPAKRNLEYFAN